MANLTLLWGGIVVVLLMACLAPHTLGDIHNLPTLWTNAAKTIRPQLYGRNVVLAPDGGRNAISNAYENNMGLNSQLPDVYHNEIMIRYTQEYLANAGATVFMTRERWFGTSDEQILDDQSSANCIKTGGWTSYGVGFLGYHSYVFGNLNAETAVAAFVTTLAADGYYPVYIRGLGDGQNRASRTLIRIFHSGGTTTLYMNQNMYSRQWMYAGRYYFTKTGFRVEVSNKLDFAVDAGRCVIADAVRVGCGSLGGYPRFHYGTSSFLTYMNYTVSTSSATAMADFSKQMIQGDLETANWQNWALFYLYSTYNSGDSAIRGTQDFSYSNGRTSPYTGITSTAIYNSSLQAASDSFCDAIHAAAVSTGLVDKAKDLHQWPPLDSSSRMPTMMAVPYYITNNADMLLAQSEAGRENLGRAYYKGIAKYFSSTATIIPLPVNYLHTINQGGNVVRVCWRQPDDTQESTDAATAFKIYRSTDGRGWDDGVIVAAFTYLNSLCYDVTSLTVGQVYFFKVAGLNAGGEALTKWTAAARVTDPAVGVTRPPIVIVDCFVEGFVHTSTNIEGRYTREYVVEHALSIAGAGYSFDSASADIFSESQWVTTHLAMYKTVVWASGDTAANINVFPAVAQTAINSWIAGASSASPRSLFVSGSNVAAGLSAAGGTSLTFLNSQLKSTFVNTNANTFVVRPNAGFTMSGTVAFNSIVALGNPYAVSSPDQIGTAGTGTAALFYGPSSGTNVAGVSSRSTTGYYASFLLAFPFETINSRDERDKLMASILSTIMFAAPDLPLALPSVSSAASMATQASVASRSSASIAATVSASVASIASIASTVSATVASASSASVASESSASIASASSASMASASSASIASASSESAASASAASGSSASAASASSASGAPVVSDTAPPPNSSSFSVAPVAGAVGGGAGLIIVIVLVVLLRQRRRRQQKSNPNLKTKPSSVPAIHSLELQEPMYTTPAAIYAAAASSTVVYAEASDNTTYPSAPGFTEATAGDAFSNYAGNVRSPTYDNANVGAAGASSMTAAIYPRVDASQSSKPATDSLYDKVVAVVDLEEYNSATSSRIYDYALPLTHLLRERLDFGSQLGSGAFGVVRLGQLPRSLVPAMARDLLVTPNQPFLNVAIKTLQEGASEKNRSEFVEEASMVAKFNNPNIVRAIAVLLEAEPCMIILELMPFGDLRKVMQQSKQQNLSWTLAEFGHVLAQVASGLEYLASIRFVHRDLAARNCLVGAGLSVKISDFGLSRSLSVKDYYHMETKGRLPVRWMAPESLSFFKFSHESDIWSFGVLSWEVFSYGTSPFAKVLGRDLLAHIEAGNRLAQPKDCPFHTYVLLLSCWQLEPEKRPTGATLRQAFREMALHQPVRDIGAL